MEPIKTIDKMNELSQKKLDLVKEMLLFTRSEKEAIVSGRMEDLETFLNEKQVRMDAVDKLDEEFIAYSARLKSALSVESLEDLPRHHLPGAKELKEVVVTIHQLIGEIKSLEDENITLAKAELRETKEKIDQAENFKRVKGAYQPVNANVPSYFFDTKK